VWGTLFIEIASPVLLWTRLRWLMIFIATAMHAVIGVLMGLNLFELLMIVMLLAFLPDRVIRDRFRGRKDLPRLTLAFNPQAGEQARAVALALAVDVDNQISLSPSSTATAVTLTDAEKKAATGSAGVASLFRKVRLPSIMAFLLWIPGMSGLAARYLFPLDGGASRDSKSSVAATRTPAPRG
jgi:hypothetical protein